MASETTPRQIRARNARILRENLGTTHAIVPSMTTQATQTKTPAVNHAYRALLSDIICERYADRDTALCHLEVAFEDRLVSVLESRKLEASIDEHYPE